MDQESSSNEAAGSANEHNLYEILEIEFQEVNKTRIQPIACILSSELHSTPPAGLARAGH